MKAAGRAEPVCISSSGAAEVTSSSEVPSIKQEAYGGEDNERWLCLTLLFKRGLRRMERGQPEISGMEGE